MKSLHTLILLVITTFICCNTSNNKEPIDRIIYKTKHDELVLLSIITDSTYHIDWLISGTMKKHETPHQTDISGKLNFFGLIQYEGGILYDNNKLTLVEKIIKNSLKMHQSKEIKAPLDTSADMIYYKDSKSLKFNNELLIEKKEFSIEKALELIDKHENWNGEKINREFAEE
ncbi:hypothetical protein [Aquimarina longa]|uniref:hypothetical protein n=1 Tax=Aquimarina longa TaxID=1080221 RepID=UPI0007817502|nr:hypothetical protein [Aquimarina longa]